MRLVLFDQPGVSVGIAPATKANVLNLRRKRCVRLLPVFCDEF
jgi:hypothetical protein